MGSWGRGCSWDGYDLLILLGDGVILLGDGDILLVKEAMQGLQLLLQLGNCLEGVLGLGHGVGEFF
jgi:hypothetical protein